MPGDENLEQIEAALVANFLTRYYAVLADKPEVWTSMVERLKSRNTVPLLPL
ncbi:hypothetical protein D3C86_2130760 [compost metagenome]